MKTRRASAKNTLIRILGQEVSKLRAIIGHPIKLIVAVSGGMDSSVLLHVFSQLSNAHEINLVVGHVNHRLRAESDAEEDFVRKMAQQYGLECVVFQAPSCPATGNMEQWARSIRYDYLEALRKEKKASLIVTAHHQLDQAETLLQRLFSGRLASKALSIAETNLALNIWRPLLRIEKELICAYCKDCSLEYVVDESNADTSFTRNSIRHELLPFLKAKYNPNLVEGLAVFAGRLNLDENYLWRLAAECGAVPEHQNVKNFFDAVPQALRWRVLQLEAIKQIGVDAGKIGYKALFKLLRLMELGDNHRRRVDLGHGIMCLLDGSRKLSFSRVGSSQDNDKALVAQTVLGIPARLKQDFVGLGNWELSSEIVEIENPEQIAALIAEVKHHEQHKSNLKIAYFDYHILNETTLDIRARNRGDLVYVWKRGRRKLKKLFQEKGFPLDVRAAIPVIRCRSGILWVPGVVRSNCAGLHSETRLVLKLSYKFDFPHRIANVEILV